MEKQPCQRARALWRNSEPIAGFYCSYAYSGTIPCTGELRCILCGGLKFDNKRRS